MFTATNFFEIRKLKKKKQQKFTKCYHNTIRNEEPSRHITTFLQSFWGENQLFICRADYK